jgi:mRNA interferase MazF
VVAFISSNINDLHEESDIVLKKENDIFDCTGLHVDSVIKLHRMVTIPKLVKNKKISSILKISSWVLIVIVIGFVIVRFLI